MADGSKSWIGGGALTLVAAGVLGVGAWLAVGLLRADSEGATMAAEGPQVEPAAPEVEAASEVWSEWQPMSGSALTMSRRPAESEEGPRLRPGSVIGSVARSNGEPVAALLFLESVDGPSVLGTGIVSTKLDGTFLYRTIWPGRYRVRTVDPTYRRPVYSEAFEVHSGLETEVEPIVIGIPPVTGLILSGTLWLRPAPGAPIRPVRNPIGGHELVALGEDGTVHRCMTDTRGRFEFAGLPHGTYTIVVESQRYRSEPSNRYRAGARGVQVIAVGGQRVLRGTVTDEARRPIRRGLVVVHERHGSVRFRRWSGMVWRGRYTTQGLPPGGYEFTFSAKGFDRTVVPVTVSTGRAPKVNAVLRKP